MSDEKNVLPFAKVSSKPSTTSKPDHNTPIGTKAATKAAERILSCYPDGGKATPEYIVNLIDVIATYPNHVVAALTDLRTGIPAFCQFIPTVSDVVRMGNQLLKTVTEAPPTAVRIFAGTPQWQAWERAGNPNSPTGTWPRTERLNPATSRIEWCWYFPSEWPPGHVASAAPTDGAP